MREYRQIRTITGQKIFVKETREERAERIMFRLEVFLAPIVVIIAFAAAAGMIPVR